MSNPPTAPTTRMGTRALVMSAEGKLSRTPNTRPTIHRGHGTTHQATERRTFYFLRSKLQYAFKFFGPLGAAAVVAVTLLLEPVARIVAAPRSAGDTLRVFARLWRELPAILRGERRGGKGA